MHPNPHLNPSLSDSVAALAAFSVVLFIATLLVDLAYALERSANELANSEIRNITSPRI
jgi:hypothetical protein